jgi:hypothetical protein
MKPRPEFRRPLAVSALPSGGQAFSVFADPDEREALRRRFGVVAIDRLEAHGEVVPRGGRGEVRLAGRLNAVVRQTCVVTLEVFASEIEAPFEMFFSPHVGDEWADAERTGGEVVVEDAAADFLEPLTDGTIDVGEAVAQQLALELDPHPRKPAARLAQTELQAATAPEAVVPSPFATLARLRDGNEPTPH